MQSITLTIEQRNRLLEMASHFFPEYKDVQTEYTGNDYVGDIHITHMQCVALPRVAWANITDYIAWDYIHWFEFLCYHLLPKMDYTMLSFFMSVKGIGTRIHPIDALYNHFKLVYRG